MDSNDSPNYVVTSCDLNDHHKWQQVKLFPLSIFKGRSRTTLVGHLYEIHFSPEDNS